MMHHDGDGATAHCWRGRAGRVVSESFIPPRHHSFVFPPGSSTSFPRTGCVTSLSADISRIPELLTSLFRGLRPVGGSVPSRSPRCTGTSTTFTHWPLHGAAVNKTSCHRLLNLYSRTPSHHSCVYTFACSPQSQTKTTLIPRGLGNAYRRIEAKLRHSRSMDMTQLAAFPLHSNSGARALRSHHHPRPDSPASTRSGSSPETESSRKKAGIDAERARLFPSPNGFTQPTSDEVFLTVPNRKIAAVIPYPLPSQSQLVMARPVSPPVSPSFLGSFDSHTSTASSRTSPPSIGLDAYSSSFCAGAIAAHAAVADSTLQPPMKTHSPSTTLSLPPLSPNTSTHLSYCQRSPQSVACVQACDVSSLHVFSDGLDASLPPVERPLRHPACLIPGTPLNPAVGPQRSASTSLPTKFSIEGVSARFSPAIITRQPQHPILSLPPISPPLSPATDSRRLRSHSLRSVPALPMEGSENMEPAEHHNAALDDLDEEEDGVVDGDEDVEVEHPDTESDDGESTSSQPSSEPSRPSNLPAIDLSPLDLSFVGADTSGTIRRNDKTPKDSRMSDYFTLKITEPISHSPVHSFRPFPAASVSTRTTPMLPTSIPSPSVLSAAWTISGSRTLPTPTTPIINVRPGMYHQASRSMSDMSEILKKSHRTSKVVVETPKSPLRNPLSEVDSPALETEPEEPDTKLAPSLRRRLSMPTFGPSSAPPPYPQFRFGERGPTIQPRDEEGHERLPHYTNDIYLRAIMPRKMEFTAPGVQARDRKWRRVLCVLEGTAFRVYKCPATAAGKGLIGNLWEKTVGAGDIAVPPPLTSPFSAKAKEKEQERDARQRKFGSADGTMVQSPISPTSPSTVPSSQPPDELELQSSSSTRSRLLPSNFRRKNRHVSDKSLGSPSEFGTRRSFSNPHDIRLDLSSGRTTTLPAPANGPTSRTPSESTSSALRSPRATGEPCMKRRSLWVDDPAVPQPQEQDLLHSYGLCNAESGLGSDYLKRRNVIRIRAEGQQFLLQARDITSVVGWIEVRHPAVPG